MKFKATVAQEAPRKETSIIVKMNDYVAKLSMSGTPNVKCGDYFVNEVNPIYLMPGYYRVYMKTPLDKKVFRGDIMQMQTLDNDNEIFEYSTNQINELMQIVEYDYMPYAGPMIFDKTIISNYAPNQIIQSVRQLDRLINQSVTFDENADKQKLRNETINSQYNSIQDFTNNFIKSRNITLNLNVIDHIDYGTNNQIPKNTTNSLILSQVIDKNYIHPETINESISFNQIIIANIYNAESVSELINFNQSLNKQGLFNRISINPYVPAQNIGDNIIDQEDLTNTPLNFNQNITPQLILSKIIVSFYTPNQTLSETFSDIELVSQSLVLVSTINYNFNDVESLSSTPIIFTQTIAPKLTLLRSIVSTPLNFQQIINAIHVNVSTVTSTYVPVETINKSYIAPRSIASTQLGFTGTQVIKLNIVDLEVVTSTFTPTQPANIVNTFVAGTKIFLENGTDRLLLEDNSYILQE